MNFPFKSITLEQIVEIGKLTDAVRAHYAEQTESGFYSIDDALSLKTPEVETIRNAKIAELSREARQELIALLIFGRRADRDPRYWDCDLRMAWAQLDNPNIFDTDNLGGYIRLGLRAFMGKY